MRWVLLLMLVTLPALAADAGPELTDASLPDASMGEGNPNMSEEGEDGQLPVLCQLQRDCERGFTCIDGKCRYTGARTATCQGCGGSAMGALFVGVGVLLSRRRAARP